MLQTAKSATDDLNYRYALCAVQRLRRDSLYYVGSFMAALKGLRARNGPRPAYARMEVAANNGVADLAKLLLDETDNGNLIRSMAPLYSIIDQAQRRQILALHAEKRRLSGL